MKYLHSTASKQPGRFPSNYPKWVIKGEGAYVFDEDGKKYLDYCMALGPIILGYRYPEVDEAVIKTIQDEGTIFSLQHPKERVLADLICEMLPGMQKVKFAHNGKDVTAAAVRLARRVSGRDLVVSFSYHGSTDVFLASDKADKGVPQELKKLITTFEYNDFERMAELFKKYGHQIACVIMEPQTIKKPKKDYLETIREYCTDNKSLLIFDEVVSFPRYKRFSAQSFYKVKPDLTCISKAMANGYAISTLAGVEKYMNEFADGGVFNSTTFGGNLVGVSAAIATLNIVKDQNVPEYLDEIGGIFKERLKGVIKLKGTHNCRQFLGCEDDVRVKVWQEAIKRGIFLHVPIFFSYSHSKKDIVLTTENITDIVKNIDKIKVEGEMPSEVFKKK